MDKQTRDNFLKIFYLKANGSTTTQVDPQKVGMLMGIYPADVHTVTAYFTGKDFLDATKGYGRNILLTTSGVDYIEELKQGRKFIKVKFLQAQFIQIFERDLKGFIYTYEVVYADGTKNYYHIKVYVSHVLAINWNLDFNPNLDRSERMLLQFAKDKVIEKVKEGTLDSEEDLTLFTNNTPDRYPYDPSILPETKYSEYEIEIGNTVLAHEIAENKLAASIIETRDKINALFDERHKGKLLLLNEERNLLDFFKSANTQEEFTHRLFSLAEVSRNLDIVELRKKTGVDDPKQGSVALLEIFLSGLGKPSPNVIQTLRKIGKIRNGYPNHTDSVEHVKAYQFFGFEYPIEDYEAAWTTLLISYLQALKELLNAL